MFSFKTQSVSYINRFILLLANFSQCKFFFFHLIYLLIKSDPTTQSCWILVLFPCLFLQQDFSF